jgi:hypothetical protein
MPDATLDPASMSISERIVMMAAAKSRVAELEGRREYLVRCGRALGDEIAEVAYQLFAEKSVRAHRDKLVAEEAVLQTDARCISLALDRARRRLAELDVLFSRTPAMSERDRLAKAEIARRFGEATNGSIAD